MDKYLKPARFSCDPNASGADKQFKHWLRTFQNFIKTINTAAPTTTATATTTETTDGDTTATAAPADDLKLTTLTNYVEANVFEYIQDCQSYDEAIETLTKIYVKPVNEIYARYKLSTCQQAEGESLDTFIQNLQRLSKDCNFKEVNAEEHRRGYVRDAFISGIRSREIRQKLLENTDLSMDDVFLQARTLHTAHTNAAQYNSSHVSCATNVVSDPELYSDSPMSGIENVENVVAVSAEDNCKYCGFPTHPRSQCPAKKHKCKVCGKSGHWERVCFKAQQQPQQQQQQQQQQQHYQQQQQQQQQRQQRQQ